MSHILHTRKFYFASTIIAGSVLASLAGLFIFNFLHIFTTTSAHAETASTSTETEVSVDIEPTITIWTTDTSGNSSDAVNISAQPNSTVATGSIRAHVATNNLTGYTLTIQSDSDEAKMTRSDSVNATINPITGNGTSATSWTNNSDLNNMWGYSVGSNDSYLGVPGSSSSAATLNTSAGPDTDSSTDVTFGTKVGPSLPAGTYTNTVIFSAVANVVPKQEVILTSINGKTNLQDLTAADCAAAKTYDGHSYVYYSYNLTDIRDNNTYKVRKLKMSEDGSTAACWMAENLKLTYDSVYAVKGDAVLTSDDTNISSDFALPTQKTDAWCTTTEKSCLNATNHVDAGNNYGTYFSWGAAIADPNSYDKVSTTVDTSICPGKGAGTTNTWHLPSGGSAELNSEWYQLFSAYRPQYGWSTVTGYDPYMSSENNLDPTIGPSFTYAGYRLGNRIIGQGEGDDGRGDWWSSTTGSTVWYANSAFLQDKYTNSVSGVNRFRGNAVRCVLPAST